ncbi:MAG: hypothetical protein K1X63_04720 [Chitinophagales bacterium]|nr:hypothetical protein [Chitinophagales bacterium]
MAVAIPESIYVRVMQVLIPISDRWFAFSSLQLLVWLNWNAHAKTNGAS